VRRRRHFGGCDAGEDTAAAAPSITRWKRLLWGAIEDKAKMRGLIAGAMHSAVKLASR
jgi:hypothetical protein